jgi:hypothetical protein
LRRGVEVRDVDFFRFRFGTHQFTFAFLSFAISAFKATWRSWLPPKSG